MSDDNIERLRDINEKLKIMNEALEALNRVMTEPDPDPDDVAFLTAFANGTLDDEYDDWIDDEEDEWVDDTWDDVVQSLPWQLIIEYKSKNS